MIHISLNTLTYLAIALLVALLSSKIAKKFKFPNVTAYLVIGIVVGPYCLNLIDSDTVNSLSIISDMALGFIAFSIGAEFKLEFLKKVGKAPVVIAVLEGVCATLLVDFVLIVTGHNVTMSLCIGAIASATAAASTLMIVKQYKAKGPVTSTLLPVVALDDAVALMAFGISVAIAKMISTKGSGDLVSMILNPVKEIFGAILFGAALGALMSLMCKWFTGRGNRLAVTIAFIFACIGISNMVDFSALLACMVMSTVFANMSPVEDKIYEPLDRMTPPIYMLFFIVSGASLDITIIPKVGVVGIIYIVFRCLGKFLGSMLGATICKTEKNVKKFLGLTLIPQEGVAIGLVTVAMGAVPEYGSTIRTVVLCGIIVFELVGPVVTKLSLKKAGELTVS